MEPLLLGGAALAALAYLSSRHGSVSSGRSVATPQPGGAPKAIDVQGMTSGEKRRLAKDVPYSRFGDILVRGAVDGSQMPVGFKECYLDTGANIPLSAVTQKDINLAAQLLGGELDRAAETYTPRALEIIKAQDQIRAGKTVTDLFSSILSFIPVYGALVKTALQLASADMQKGIDSLSQKLSSGKVRLAIDMTNANDVTKMVLGNPTTDDLYLGAPLNTSGSAYTHAGVTRWGVRQGMLPEYMGQGDRFASFDMPAPDDSLPHCRLWTQTRSGYVLPWLSLDLGASAVPPKYLEGVDQMFSTPDEGNFDPREWVSTMTWEEAIYRRAMCMRIFDAMICSFWPPLKPLNWGDPVALGRSPGKYQSNAGAFPYTGERYTYHSPIYGDLFESVYPPFPGEDTNVVIDGVKLDFHGNISDQAVVESKLNTATDSIVLAQANAPGVAQGQPLENFSTPPNPSPAPAVITRAASAYVPPAVVQPAPTAPVASQATAGTAAPSRISLIASLYR